VFFGLLTVEGQFKTMSRTQPDRVDAYQTNCSLTYMTSANYFYNIVVTDRMNKEE